jgi:nucleotide-binding universal stress UspA family protein
MATKPVIVGVDGSEESLRAVEWAALEARRHGSPNDPGQRAWAETRLVPRARGSLPAGRRLKEMA